MLIAHDLMLVLLRDKPRRRRFVTAFSEILGGALLIELAADGAVDVAGRDEDVRTGRLIVRPGARQPGDPLLAHAFDVVADKQGRKPERVLGTLGKGLAQRLADDLVGAGRVRAEPHRVLGMFPSTRYPTTGTAYELELHARLAAVLTGQEEADARTGPLIALLAAGDLLTRTIPVEDRKRAKKIAATVADGAWAAEAVRDAVRAVQTTATMVAVMAASSGGGATN